MRPRWRGSASTPRIPWAGGDSRRRSRHGPNSSMAAARLHPRLCERRTDRRRPAPHRVRRGRPRPVVGGAACCTPAERGRRRSSRSGPRSRVASRSWPARPAPPVAHPGDEGGQHRPRRRTAQTGRGRRELDRGVLRHRSQPGGLPSAIAHQLEPTADQHPRPADVGRRHGRRTDLSADPAPVNRGVSRPRPRHLRAG